MFHSTFCTHVSELNGLITVGEGVTFEVEGDRQLNVRSSHIHSQTELSVFVLGSRSPPVILEPGALNLDPRLLLPGESA